MRIDIVTLFPDMFDGPFRQSIIKRAIANGIVEIVLHNLREYGLGRHRVIDDYPHGGGVGMVLRPEPLFAAVEAIGTEPNVPVILLTPQGRLFSQEVAEGLATYAQILLICGRYEGVDERVRENLATDEISIGDYVLTGGEVAAMVVVDAVTRQLPGALGSEKSLKDESHVGGLLEGPQYTRPQTFRGWDVPPVLLSGNHAEIARWRRKQAIMHTLSRRPDLLGKAQLSEEERRMVEEDGYRIYAGKSEYRFIQSR